MKWRHKQNLISIPMPTLCWVKMEERKRVIILIVNVYCDKTNNISVIAGEFVHRREYLFTINNIILNKYRKKIPGNL